jgi:hypothetical protein
LVSADAPSTFSNTTRVKQYNPDAMERRKLRRILDVWLSHMLASQVLAMTFCVVLYFTPPPSAPPLTLINALLMIFLAPLWSPLFFFVLPVYVVAHGHARSYWIPIGFAVYISVFAIYYRRRNKLNPARLGA